MTLGGLDAQQPGSVAHRNVEETAIPGEVLGPGLPRDALDPGIGFPAVPRLVPGLEPERWDSELRSRQCLRRAQDIHSRRVQPDASLSLAGGHVDDADPADAGPAQREGKRAAALTAA